METMYVTLDAKRLTLCAQAEGRRACGGQETVCYAVAPRKKRARPAGKVVEFEPYRRAAVGLPAETAAEADPVPQGEDSPAGHGRMPFLLLADLCASGAVVVLLAALVVKFFAL